jgi:hypothetical protein
MCKKRAEIRQKKSRNERKKEESLYFLKKILSPPIQLPS